MAIEIAMMAADAGLVRTECRPSPSAGTFQRRDTAVVLLPSNAQDFFDLKILEFICLPSENHPPSTNPATCGMKIDRIIRSRRKDLRPHDQKRWDPGGTRPLAATSVQIERIASRRRTGFRRNRQRSSSASPNHPPNSSAAEKPFYSWGQNTRWSSPKAKPAAGAHPQLFPSVP